MRQGVGDEVIPATWTHRQITQVEGLRCRIEVDQTLLASGGDVVRESIARRIIKAIIHEARPFVVEVHPADVQVVEADGGQPFTTTFVGRWAPSTKVVELVGGSADGEVIEVRRVGDVLAIPRLVQLDPRDPRWSTDVDPSEPLFQQDRDHYRLTGWSEHNRRWVYTLDA